METAFGRYHPAINFIFFAGAIGLGMFIVHPAFLLVSVACASCYFFLLFGRKRLGYFASLLLLMLLIGVVNPLFNQNGETVLFRYFSGRPYTLEALYYGFATGAMFFTVLIWFACYNRLMSSDKFIYLFGRLAPALSLLLSMVLRLVPLFRDRIRTVSGVRQCIGKGPKKGKQGLANSFDILSVLMTWSLEGAVVTADSMRSRGYGSARRTGFLSYRFRPRDYAACIALGVFALGVIAAAAFGAAQVQYTPRLEIRPMDLPCAAGLVCYGGMLLIPSVIHISEELSWHISRSKI